MLCDYDRQRAMHYLDRLVALNDPGAVHDKSALLAQEDPEESARLLRRARELGWSEPTRQDEMKDLATRP